MLVHSQRQQRFPYQTFLDSINDDTYPKMIALTPLHPEKSLCTEVQSFSFSYFLTTFTTQAGALSVAVYAGHWPVTIWAKNTCAQIESLQNRIGQTLKGYVKSSGRLVRSKVRIETFIRISNAKTGTGADLPTQRRTKLTPVMET